MYEAAEMIRKGQLNIRLSEVEHARLQALAEHYGLNVAAMLRMLAKREADVLGLTIAQRPAVAVKAKRKSK